MLQKSEKIGGPGKTVQIDESIKSASGSIIAGIESKDNAFLEVLRKIPEKAF